MIQTIELHQHSLKPHKKRLVHRVLDSTGCICILTLLWDHKQGIIDSDIWFEGNFLDHWANKYTIEKYYDSLKEFVEDNIVEFL